MLYHSLALSTLLLLAANWAARGRRRLLAGAIVVGLSIIALIAPVFVGFLSPPVFFQTLSLCGIVAVWLMSGRGPALFLALSVGATLIVWTLLMIPTLDSEREYARLRALYTYESMESRLPIPQTDPEGLRLAPAASERLSRLETEVLGREGGYREYQLWSLHEQAVSLFVDSPGFGVSRLDRPSKWNLAFDLRGKPVPLQPGPRFSSTWSPGELGRLADGDTKPLDDLLEASILDFVYPEGFGYFKDRRHVAGFEAHRFSAVPEPAKRWKVQALELVSLLLHDEPEVYESPRLPGMDRLHALPTRPLDRFERHGLDALRQGEDLFATQGGEGVRMLGAVRSFKQCLPCHGGGRGDLLGAFSYTLRAVEP